MWWLKGGRGFDCLIQHSDKLDRAWGQVVRSSVVMGSILEKEEASVVVDKVLMSLSPSYGAIKEIEHYSGLYIWGGVT